jgi:hypothetical protein
VKKKSKNPKEWNFPLLHNEKLAWKFDISHSKRKEKKINQKKINAE